MPAWMTTILAVSAGCIQCSATPTARRSFLAIACPLVHGANEQGHAHTLTLPFCSDACYVACDTAFRANAIVPACAVWVPRRSAAARLEKTRLLIERTRFTGRQCAATACGLWETEAWREQSKSTFKVCDGCKWTYYCSKSCQRADWKCGDHKIACRARRNMCDLTTEQLTSIGVLPECATHVPALEACTCGGDSTAGLALPDNARESGAALTQSQAMSHNASLYSFSEADGRAAERSASLFRRYLAELFCACGARSAENVISAQDLCMESLLESDCSCFDAGERHRHCASKSRHCSRPQCAVRVGEFAMRQNTFHLHACTKRLKCAIHVVWAMYCSARCQRLDIDALSFSPIII